MRHNSCWFDDLKWFEKTREQLSGRWNQGCTNIVGRVEEDTCCQLFSDVVDMNDGHISIACSLIEEQEQIAELLSHSGFDNNPILFFKLLLFLLDEFTERISKGYILLGDKQVKQPKLISLWANKYAKHRLALFIQHHVRHVFYDGDQIIYQALSGGGEINGMCLRSGYLPETVFVLDHKWLENNTGHSEINLTNKEMVPVILIPPLQSFIDETLDYYRNFIDFAKQRPEELKRFQSNFHWPITPEIEEEILKLYAKHGVIVDEH